MTRTACKDCPFRPDSRFAYDSDAMEALNDGMAPSCHMVVGLDSIFGGGAAPCAGFEAWERDRPGFVLPASA